MTKKIPVLSKCKIFIALVDDEDYPVVSRHKWYILWSKKRPYAFTRLYNEDKKNGKTFLMHHLILGTSAQTDHKNTNSLDNQKGNLRPSTHSQNGGNMRKMPLRNGKPTSSKYKGVFFDRGSGMFRAQIVKDRKRYGLGAFAHEDDAGRAYNAKAAELYGEFALLNKII